MSIPTRQIAYGYYLDHFHLPFPIDRQTHESTLYELDLLDMSPRLIHARSIARSTLTTTAEDLIGFINGEAQRYSRFPSEEEVTAFRNNTDAILKQLQLANSNITQLTALYDLLKEGYYGFAANTTKAVEQGQLWLLFRRNQHEIHHLLLARPTRR